MNNAAQALAGVRALSRFRQPTGPAARGYHVTYRADAPMPCPGCGRSHWHVGRLSAECAFCGTALPLEAPIVTGPGTFRVKDHRQLKDARYG